ncbi:predicted protein [Chaetoceros tenuissimus]|uniref:Uncharacterized protein n=1 Tax=Chaetoceros tenuissimus TaxID=426638 RepID=A0AAD3HD68_9STRA|nr:predicted protein [Chaetoceros tenuissimus]
MTHQITKVVSAMSSMHRVKVLCRDYFYNPQNIQKILGSTMLFGCAAGYQTMEYIHQNRLEEQERHYMREYETYSSERDRYDEKYATALDPSLALRRKITRTNSVVFTRQYIDESKDQLRLIQE